MEIHENVLKLPEQNYQCEIDLYSLVVYSMEDRSQNIDY